MHSKIINAELIKEKRTLIKRKEQRSIRSIFKIRKEKYLYDDSYLCLFKIDMI